MNDIQVKASVRERDGHKCVKCGMTRERHVEEHQTDLHVHRLFPGSYYLEGWCVTLCSPCHGKMPKHPADLIYLDAEKETGIYVFALNLFDKHNRRVYDAIARRGKESGEDDLAVIVLDILDAWAKEQQGNDYCI